MDNRMIELVDITKSYGKEVPIEVLKGINLVIEKGEFASLIGPSGSGKSTLLNVLGTLDQPTSGKVILDNEVTNQLTKTNLAVFRNRIMGFIFQFHYLFAELTALENVLLPYQILNASIDKDARERAEELIRRVGLVDQKNKQINQLSGGQQQRIAIARSLINQPKIVLADEPTGSLDTKSSEQTIELLREINQESQTTFLIVTHDRNIAIKTDRIIEIVDGKISRDFLPNRIGEAETWKELESHACLDC